MNSKGFTLIELMIVIAIIGILAAVAYPGYQEYVRKTRRAEVAVVLMGVAQAAERNYSRTGDYVDGAVYQTLSPAGGDAAFTIDLADGEAADGGYLVTASAAVGGLMAGDTCATMTINALGVRTPADDVCWRQ